jgi:outer membrane protein assembly factor BamB
LQRLVLSTKPRDFRFQFFFRCHEIHAAAQSAKFRASPVSNLILYAYDAQTGKQLYSSEKIIASWVHFSEPVVAAGKVFVVSWDAHVYAFGLKQ